MKNKKKLPLFAKIPLICLAVILVVIAVVLILYTVTEYKPDAVEELTTDGSGAAFPADKTSLSLLSWNIGYCGLSANEDFFMDGGKNIFPEDPLEVPENLEAVKDVIRNTHADVTVLQEVDYSSKRTDYLDETAALLSAFPEQEGVFAYNYNCFFVPIPVPPLGKMGAGQFTLSNYDIASAQRIQLPCPFTWPTRSCNLKRCLLVSRIPIEGSDKEWVLINLHLEAYDSGEGKIAQTRMLVDFMEAEYAKGNYVIAAGDFNQSFSNIDTSMYPVIDPSFWQCGKLDASAFGDHFSLVMDTTYPTCRSLDKEYPGGMPADFQFYMIDGFIVSSNLSIDTCETISLDFQNSDHNPVYLEVSVLP
ncbi:MAG: endonuclease/exonuclease/phosphatase family protein [Lachnospiraceae bacterium]|nr:endonuclease/exonuclease/phosphatase family protein [Lachnospiraceae bacterium]